MDERALAVCVPPTNGIAPIKPARDSLRGLRLSYGTGAREGGWAGRVRGGVFIILGPLFIISVFNAGVRGL